MEIAGRNAVVTGAGGGIGTALVGMLCRTGAAKIYATHRAGRDLLALVAAYPGKIVALPLDITDHKAVAAVAARCADTALLVNNAGVNFNTSLVAIGSLDNARTEIETNYLGTLAMCRAFAPVLKANGGGMIVNMVSILARVNLPLMGSLCASKAALLSMTQGVRAELAAQGTRVLAVMPGAVDTAMTKDFPPPKMSPDSVAAEIRDAILADAEECYPGDMARGVAAALASEPKAIEKELAKILPQ
jgi:NAD(P)-dependent dehydrogenase (short-subunit alcohol dehydrogenase family)